MPKKKPTTYTADDIRTLKAWLATKQNELCHDIAVGLDDFRQQRTFDNAVRICDLAQYLTYGANALDNIDMFIESAERNGSVRGLGFNPADCGLENA